jgi:glycosyltransferase involved in cell wall biosynthesis
MRLIILNQFFYPDHSATSQLMTELAESLVEQGVEVTALAGRGRYNGGERLAPEEDYKGARIRRAWSTSFGKKNIIGRLFDYASFYLGATVALLRMPRHDIVMALTTPPLIGLVALLVGRLRGMRVVSLVQDVYPDIAVTLGALSASNPATRILDWLNRFVLRGVDRTIVLSDCMRDRIAAKVANRLSTIDVIHNWADGEKIVPLDADNPFVAANGLEGAFVVLFSGNFGNVNEFSTVLDAAHRLSARTNIVFLFIGEGAKANEIRDYAEQRGLNNIRLLSYQPLSLLPFSLAAGDVSLVTLADGLAGLSVPSKTYAILASGRPILFVGDLKSDIARLVLDNQCGAAVAAGDSVRLSEIILEWSLDPTKMSDLGAESRKLFEKRFDRGTAVAAYMQSFERCMETEPRPLLVTSH